MNYEAALAGLLRKERIAHIATLRQGAPVAGMAVVLPAGAFSGGYVHVRRSAWHTQDMLQDPRVALSIAETDDGRKDPFTLMRISIRGNAENLPSEQPELKKLWLERFPEQKINFELADFSFW